MADEDGMKKCSERKKIRFFVFLIRYSTIRRYSNSEERRSINTSCEICGNTTTTERYCMMKRIFDFDWLICF